MSDCNGSWPDREGPWREVPDGEVVEIPLLLPGWQMNALERAAHHRGVTAAEMVRSLLRDSIRQLTRAGRVEAL
jgi:hypothetical protein